MMAQLQNAGPPAVDFSPVSASFSQARARTLSPPPGVGETHRRSKADNWNGDGSKTRKKSKMMARKYGSAHGQYVDRRKHLQRLAFLPLNPSFPGVILNKSDVKRGGKAPDHVKLFDPIARKVSLPAMRL